MVKIHEHLEKIKFTEQQIKNSNGRQKLQYIKRLHRLKKQLAQCYIYMCK